MKFNTHTLRNKFKCFMLLCMFTIGITLTATVNSHAQSVPVMKAEKVWFDLHNITDLMVSLNGAMYAGGAGIPVFPVPITLQSQFWTQQDADGNIKLCTFKTSLPATMVAAFLDNSIFPAVLYNIKAKNFTAVMHEDNTIVWYPQ